MSRGSFIKSAAGAVVALITGVRKLALAQASALASWPHQLEGLMQNAVGSTQGPAHMHWDLPHDDFRLDFCFQVFNSKSGTQGWFIYREQDTQNFYQLEMRATSLTIVKRVAGVFSDVKSCPYALNPSREAMLRIQAIGGHHQVWQLNEDGSVGALLIDLQNETTFLAGVNHSYYTQVGINGCWEFAKGGPL